MFKDNVLNFTREQPVQAEPIQATPIENNNGGTNAIFEEQNKIQSELYGDQQPAR